MSAIIQLGQEDVGTHQRLLKRAWELASDKISDFRANELGDFAVDCALELAAEEFLRLTSELEEANEAIVVLWRNRQNSAPIDINHPAIVRAMAPFVHRALAQKETK